MIVMKQVRQPLVSVIIPVYNCEQYIEEALRSVYQQTYSNIEIIVVDDGSTDRTPEILKNHSTKIRLFHQENAGSAAARNRALDNAFGELIAFIDGDDYWHPEKLSIQVEHLEQNPDVGVVASKIKYYWPVQDGVYPNPDESFPGDETDTFTEIYYDDIFHSYPISTMSIMMRREVVENTGKFDLTMRKGQDHDYWLRMAWHTRIHKLERTLALYRMNPQSVTFNPGNVNYAAMSIRKALRRWGRKTPSGRLIPRSAVRKKLAKTWKDFAYMHYKYGSKFRAVFALGCALYYRPAEIARLLKVDGYELS